MAAARNKEGLGTLKEAGAGAGKSNDLAGAMEKGLEELGRGRGREQEGTKAGSNELAGARTKEAWGTLAEAGAGAVKSNDLAGEMDKG